MCGKHDISLTIELRSSGYMNGEWICKDFEDNGRAFPVAVKEFQEKIHDEMRESILYSLYNTDDGTVAKFLEEHPFEELTVPQPHTRLFQTNPSLK